MKVCKTDTAFSQFVDVGRLRSRFRVVVCENMVTDIIRHHDDHVWFCLAENGTSQQQYQNKCVKCFHACSQNVDIEVRAQARPEV